MRAPILTRIFAGWRTRTISKSSSRLRISFTGRPLFSVSATQIGCTCGSVLLPKPAPMRGVRLRTRDIGSFKLSHTPACTRNTDWLADHRLMRPLASISASAPQGSSETCACAGVSNQSSTIRSHSRHAASMTPTA